MCRTRCGPGDCGSGGLSLTSRNPHQGSPNPLLRLRAGWGLFKEQEHRSDPHSASQNGNTALINAAKKEYLDVVQQLLEAGADTEKKDKVRPRAAAGCAAAAAEAAAAAR